jgi:pimeloyl-ACP methyl ester carboxylesterase
MLNVVRRGSGPQLVLLHGIGMDWRAWEPVLDALAVEREVFAIDLPGFGDSPPLASNRRPTVPALADGIVAGLAEHGVESAHVAGNSLGGGLALELARRGWAQSATAVSPIGFMSRAEYLYLRASVGFNAVLAPLMAPFADAIAGNGVTRAAVFNVAVAHPERLDPELAASHIRAVANGPGFGATRRAALHWRPVGGFPPSRPVTIAWGDKDRLLIPRQAERARAALPHARHVTLQDCGHVPMSDDPAQVVEVLLEGSR